MRESSENSAMFPPAAAAAAAGKVSAAATIPPKNLSVGSGSMALRAGSADTATPGGTASSAFGSVTTESTGRVKSSFGPGEGEALMNGAIVTASGGDTIVREASTTEKVEREGMTPKAQMSGKDRAKKRKVVGEPPQKSENPVEGVLRRNGHD